MAEGKIHLTTKNIFRNKKTSQIYFSGQERAVKARTSLFFFNPASKHFSAGSARKRRRPEVSHLRCYF